VRALYSEALKKFTETAFVTKFESLLPVGYAAECVPEAGRVGGGLV